MITVIDYPSKQYYNKPKELFWFVSRDSKKTAKERKPVTIARFADEELVDAAVDATPESDSESRRISAEVVDNDAEFGREFDADDDVVDRPAE